MKAKVKEAGGRITVADANIYTSCIRCPPMQIPDKTDPRRKADPLDLGLRCEHAIQPTRLLARRAALSVQFDQQHGI